MHIFCLPAVSLALCGKCEWPSACLVHAHMLRCMVWYGMRAHLSTRRRTTHGLPALNASQVYAPRIPVTTGSRLTLDILKIECAETNDFWNTSTGVNWRSWRQQVNKALSEFAAAWLFPQGNVKLGQDRSHSRHKHRVRLGLTRVAMYEAHHAALAAARRSSVGERRKVREHVISLKTPKFFLGQCLLAYT